MTEDWKLLCHLVQIVEDYGFSLDESKRLPRMLLDFAVRHRNSDEVNAPAVLSAIRTGASMVEPWESSRLLQLMEPGHAIDTQLVALKMLGRIFEARPPNELDQYRSGVSATVSEVAFDMLDADRLDDSRDAAKGQLAIYALAAMGSNEALGMARVVREMDISWFTKQTARELRQLRSTWKARPEPVAFEVREFLDAVIRELGVEVEDGD